MGMRLWAVAVVGMACFVMTPATWAADGSATDSAAAGIADTTRDQVLQEIEATRQTDPELAKEMEAQLGLLESGELTLPQPKAYEGGLALGAPPSDVLGGTNMNPQGNFKGMNGAPVGGDGTAGSEQERRFMQVQSDPRMEDVRRQLEGGQLSEQQAREKVFEVMRDYGVDPNNGREGAEGRGGYEGRGNGEHDSKSQERGEGLERSWEQMSPEAREQMERLFTGHEGDQPEMTREGFEREAGSMERHFEGRENENHAGPEMIEREFQGGMERSSETPERFEAPTREFESPTREFESPTRDLESPAREVEAPTDEHEAPAFEQPEAEMPEAPTSPSQGEYSGGGHEYEQPQQQYEAPLR